jgi:phosphoglycerate kinase
MQTFKKLQFKEKRVLIRCDFNVPISDDGKVLDSFRIQETIPTIKYLIKKGAKLLLISHLGRPAGRELKYSLRPIVERLEELLKKKVFFASDCVGEKIKKEVEKLKSGEIILLENLRFYKEEEENTQDFARKLANLADIYINDAFGASHRVHASIVGIPKFLPSTAGLLLEKEIKILEKIIKNPKKPLISIIGGAKAETKIGVINKILPVSDFVLVGGLMQEEIFKKKSFLKESQKIIFPQDSINKGKDIGPLTINLFKKKIIPAKTIFWNGPLGQIEKKEFSKGTEEITKAIIKSKAFSVVGGGETIEFINRLDLTKKFNHISTGGGAMLEFLAGEKLPGIEVLKNWW